MTWNYSLILHDLDPDKNRHWIGLHEIHYDDNRQIIAWTENTVTFVCGADETDRALIRSIERALVDVRFRDMLQESALEAERARRGATRDGET